MADPLARLAAIRRGLSPAEWTRVGAMTAAVVGLNVLGWGLLAAAAGHHYHVSRTTLFGFGTGVLADTLGMRHAFDADHIAAIDNTTRKLISEGKRPLGGVLLLPRALLGRLRACLLLARRPCPPAGHRRLVDAAQTTGLIGTSVSGASST